MDRTFEATTLAKKQARVRRGNIARGCPFAEEDEGDDDDDDDEPY